MGDQIYNLSSPVLTKNNEFLRSSGEIVDDPSSDYKPANATWNLPDQTFQSDRHWAIDSYLRDMTRSLENGRGLYDLNPHKDKPEASGGTSVSLSPNSAFQAVKTDSQTEDIYDLNPRPDRDLKDITIPRDTSMYNLNLKPNTKCADKFEVNLPILTGSMTTRRRNVPPPPPRTATLPRSMASLAASFNPSTINPDSDPANRDTHLSPFTAAETTTLDGYEKFVSGLSPINESGSQSVHDSGGSCPPFLLPRFVFLGSVLASAGLSAGV